MNMETKKKNPKQGLTSAEFLIIMFLEGAEESIPQWSSNKNKNDILLNDDKYLIYRCTFTSVAPCNYNIVLPFVSRYICCAKTTWKLLKDVHIVKFVANIVLVSVWNRVIKVRQTRPQVAVTLSNGVRMYGQTTQQTTTPSDVLQLPENKHPLGLSTQE